MGCCWSKTPKEVSSPFVEPFLDSNTAPSDDAIHVGWIERFVDRYVRTALGLAGTAVALAPDPFGVNGILSTALDQLKQRTDEAVTNTENCRKLLEAANWSRTCLTDAPKASWAKAEEEKSKLEEALKAAAVFLESFGIANFGERLFHSGRDAADFTQHSEEITKWTQRLAFKLSLREHAAPPPAVSYSNAETEKLRATICKLGGSTDAEVALVEIKRQGRLGELTPHMSLRAQVQMAALESWAAKLEKAVSRVKLPEMLPLGLKTFWLAHFNAEEVSYDSFFAAVVVTIKGMVPGLMEAVQQRVRDRLGLEDSELLLAACSAVDDRGRSSPPRLLRQLLQAYTDPGAKGKVHVESFYKFWFSCHEWADSSKEPEPGDVPSCFEVLARHFESKLLLEPEKAELRQLEAVLHPFHFTSDVHNKLRRFQPGSRGWLFEEFEAWLALSPKDPSHRAMVLYGGPGLGKSTVAAALVAKKAVGGQASVIAGHWFCKHNDMNRSNPVLMIRTFAYQLAEAVPALRPHLLPPKLTSEEVAALVDAETAFKRLLLDPLKEVDLSSRPQPLVLVIDALDEVAVAGGSSLGANPVLRLIREHFPLLPRAVRFMLTSRPEPPIMNSLDAAIRPLKIQPDDPRHVADLRVLIQHELEKRLESSDVTHKPTAAELSEAVQLLLDKSEGVFVYLARLLDGLKAEQRWRLEDLGAFPKGLNATYTAFLERHHGSSNNPAFAETDLSRLLSVLLAVQEPPTRELLTAAWNATEELSVVDGGTAAGVQQVVKCMQPTVALVKQVKQLLGQLGSLYSVCDERVLVFHKSFHDFLESDMIAGEDNKFWVDPFKGHTLLAAVMSPLMASPNTVRVVWPSIALASTMGSLDMQPSPQPSVPQWLLSYSLRYGPHHLVELQLSGQLPAAGPLLAALMQNYAFLAEAFSSGNGHNLIRALLRLRRSPHDSTSVPAIIMDALRWMLLRQSDLLKVGISEEQVLVSCLCCPLGTLVFKQAKKAYINILNSQGRPCWIPTHVLGASTSWPACQLILSGHKGRVCSVAWSPNGQQLTSGNGDSTLRVWDAASGACVATLEGHTGHVSSVAWSPNGQQLTSGSSDKTVRVWDVASGACVATLEGHASRVNSVAWSPGGQQLASGSHDKTIRMWDATSGACVATLEGHSHNVNSVAWSPNGRQLASGSSDKTLRVWDAASGACVATLEGRTGFVFSVAWSPDGRQLASGSKDNTLDMWDATSGACVATLKGHAELVFSVAWSPDGRQLASGSWDGTLRMWDTTSGACVATLKGPECQVYSVAWSPNGRQLASGSVEKAIRVWDAATVAYVATQKGHEGGVYSVAWSPDGRQLASGSVDKATRVWDAATGACVATLEGHERHVNSLAWSPNGRQLASGSADKTLRVWDAATGACVATLEGHASIVCSVAWSPGGQQLASGSSDNTLRVWDAASGACVATLEGHASTVCSVAWSPDGRQLTSGSEDNATRVWDAATGACVATLEGHAELVSPVAWSPDGRQLASGGRDGTLRVRDAATGACVATLEGHEGGVNSVAWSPDGRQLASGSVDKTLRVWDATSGACVATLKGHEGGVYSVAWSPDGKQLASGSVDKTLRVWDGGQRGVFWGAKVC